MKQTNSNDNKAAFLEQSIKREHLQRYFNVWRQYRKERQLSAHNKRCAVMLKHNAVKNLYSRYFILWCSFTQRKQAEEIKRLFVMPVGVPLKGKRDTLNFVRRYFLKWKLFLRQTNQRKVTNVNAIQKVNEERTLVRYFTKWQGVMSSTNRKATEQLEVAAAQMDDLEQVVLRAIDALGGKATSVEEFKKRPEETPQQAALRTKQMTDTLRDLCEDMVVVLVLTSLWSSGRAEERVSESLEKLWREAQGLRESNEELGEEVKDMNQVLEACDTVLKTLARQDSFEDGELDDIRTQLSSAAKDPAERLRTNYELTGPTDLVKHCDAIAKKMELALVGKAAEVDKLKAAALRSLETISGEQPPEGASLEEVAAALEKAVAQAQQHPSGNPSAPLIEQLNQLQATNKAIEDEIKKLESDNDKLSEKLDELEEALVELGEGKSDLKAKEQDLISLNSAAQKQLAEKEKEIEALKKVNDATVAQLEKDNADLLGAALMACEALGGPRSVKDNLKTPPTPDETPRNKERRLKGVVETTNALSKEVKNALEGEESDLPLKTVLKKLRTQADDGKRNADRLNQRVEERTKERDNAREEMRNLQEKLRQAERELADQKRGLTSAENQTKKQADALEKLKEEKDKEIAELRDAVTSAVAALNGTAAQPSPRATSTSPRPVSSRASSVRGAKSPRDVTDALRSVSSQVHALLADPSQTVSVPEAIRDLKEKMNEQTAKCEGLLRNLEATTEELKKYKEVVEYSTDLLKNPSVEPQAQAKSSAASLADALSVKGEDTPSILKELAEKISEESRVFLESYYEKQPEAPSTTKEERLASEVVKEMKESALTRTAQLQEVSQQALHLEAISVFLLNLLRDAVVRLNEFTKAAKPEEHAEIDPVITESNLTPLAADSTPSMYAEHVLQYCDSPQGKTLVQQHLQEGIVLGTHPQTPSTWDVVVEFHDQIVAARGVAEQREAALQSMNVNAEYMAIAGEAVESVLGDSPKPESAEQLSNAVLQMAEVISDYRDAVKQAVESLGADPHVPKKDEDKLLSARLVEASDAAKVAQEELKKLLNVPASEGRSLSDDISSLKTKMQEMEEAKAESEILLKGLDKAFNDDLESSLSSFSSTTTASRSLKPKMKPVPAIDLKKESYSRLRHRNMPSRRATSMTPIESKMGMIRAAARMKLDDVHDLRVCARAAQNVFDGTYISDKPQTYGEALVPLLMTQIVELKKLLPEALTLIDELNGKKPVADDKERKPVPIGAVVQSLLNHLQNLMLERDAFKDQIENKNKLNKKILDASDERTQKLKEQVAQLKAQNNMLKDEKEELAVLQEELEKELEEEKDIQATAESDVKKAQAQLEKVQGETKKMEAELQQSNKQCKTLEDQLQSQLAEAQQLAALNAKRQVDVNTLAEALAVSLSDGNGNVGKTESTVRQLLIENEGKDLVPYIKENQAQEKQKVAQQLAFQKENIQELRLALEDLRASVTGIMQDSFMPLCQQVKKETENFTNALEVENNILRPRATERERLLKENKALKEEMEKVQSDNNHLRDAYDALDDKNMQLQRQIRQLEINLTLAKKEATAPVDRAAEKPYRDLLTELEAKMIRGATALTVEAVDAISGEDMSATYGYIAEQTLLLYQSTNRCLQTLHEMNGKYPPTTLENQRQFVSGVESAMQAMEKLTVNAQYLWSSIPALYRCPS